MAAAATATATVVERVDGAPSRAATVAARAAASLPPIPSLPPLPMRHDPSRYALKIENGSDGSDRGGSVTRQRPRGAV